MGQGEGQVILTYGVPKLGKTVDMGFSLPKALYLAMPGALDSIVETCGYQPDREEVRTVQEATERVKKLANSKKPSHMEVVVDDFSVMAEQTMGDLEGKVSQDKFWQKNRSIVLEFRDVVRFSGVTVALTCWESPPTTNTKTGIFSVGGPLLAGKLREHLPGLCDMVLRAAHEPQRQPWPIAYRCAPDHRWITGDRLDIAQKCDPIPMNLGELLRARGRVLPRLWADQEAEVEEIAQIILSQPVEAANDIAEAVYAMLYERHGRARAVWSVRDGLDRATIRRALASRERTFFSQKPSTAAALAAAKVG